jgi:hypothetical protein
MRLIKPAILSYAIALTFGNAPLAHAASDSELAEIRAQIRELKDQYEARIKALEERLKSAEARAAEPAPAPAPVAGGAPSSISAFNPAVSAILSGQYANLSADPSRLRLAGFPTSAGVDVGKRGFSLSESELQLSANVDHIFAGNLVFSISPENTVEVEEAYGLVNGAPYGVVPKLGRFLSGFGYLNEQHAHAWDFVDAPLAYQAFLGGQYRTDGVQLSWIAPLEHFVQLGAEVGNGASFPGTERNKNGANSGVLFARTGGDIGESHSWLASVSYLRTRAEDRVTMGQDLAGNDVPFTFTGTSRVMNAALVWKYAPNGNPRVTNFKFQAEYFRRREEGDALSSRQGGWYAQGVYQFMPLWRAGVRFDRLDAGTFDLGFHPQRATAMVDWSPSEFSRVRLQYARAKLAPDFTDNELFVQYILSLGAHGAHKF